MEEKIRKVLTQKNAVVCEVVLDGKQPFEPKVSSVKDKDGKIISKPLEDMSPLLSRGELQKNMLAPILK